MKSDRHLTFEMLRWGYASIPGAILYYSKDLNIDMEDLGIICTIFYAYEQSRPLSENGVRVGDVLRCCSSLSVNKLSRRLNRMKQQGLLEIADSKGHIFTERIIYPTLLLERLPQLIARDHPLFESLLTADTKNAENYEDLLELCQQKIARLESQLCEYTGNRWHTTAIPEASAPVMVNGNGTKTGVNALNGNGEKFRRVAEFISRKTGNLLSTNMEGELKKWLDEYELTPDFLLCMLELSFEREIINPRELSTIARELKEYGISSVEGLQLYFSNNIDANKKKNVRRREFDPEILEFGSFTGIDMNAEARKELYYRWRYDWGFTHAMIMKAGELMCRRTRSGGLEYIESVLGNWLSQEVRTPAEADKQIDEHKSRSKAARDKKAGWDKSMSASSTVEHEIFVPPTVLEELKSKSQS